MRRVWWMLMLLVTSAAAQAPSDQPSHADAASGVVVTDEGDRILAWSPAYNASIVKATGHLDTVENARGFTLLGADAGRPALGVESDGTTQAGGAFGVDVAVDGTTVTVEADAFTLVYDLLPDRIHVAFQPAVDGLDLVAASVAEPSRQAAMRYSADAYEELGGYPTDFWTDASSGQFSLWTTAAYTVGGHTYRVAMADPTLEGHCHWETPKGQVWFAAGGGHATSLGYGAVCHRAPNFVVADEVAGTPLGLADGHQVVQSFEGAAAGDTVAIELFVNDHGYDVLDVLYPISSRHTSGAQTGMTTAKLVVPWDRSDTGMPLVVYFPGHWDTKYTHSYLWDFLANHGYMVAVPFTTADMGDGHQRDDWGYTTQIEAEELRRWVISNHAIDTDQVVAAGVSLGGLNALLASINHPDAYVGTIYQSGVYDFYRFWLTPLGLASYAANVEVALCCGLPTNAYEYDIRDPRQRIDQFSGGLFITQGLADAVAPPDHAIELSLAVPGSELHLGVGAHDNNVFAGFRKEALTFLQGLGIRPETMRDTVDVRQYGHPDLVPQGFERYSEPMNYSNEWLTVWVEDAAWTHIQAQRTPDGAEVSVDRPARVAVRVPPECRPLCNATLDGTAAPIVDLPFVGGGQGIVFEAVAGTSYGPLFEAFTPALPPAPVQDSPAPAALVLLALVAALGLARRRP